MTFHQRRRRDQPTHGLLALPRRKARDGGDAQGERTTVPSLEEENRRLRRENARLLEEREILKKATAFFAKDAR